MSNTNEDGRKQRGLLIAQRCRIKKTENGWKVPSQTRHIYYVVKHGRIDGKLTCTCPDYQERLCKCKHIWAIEFVTQSARDDNGNMVVSKFVKVTYPQKWKAYDKAQSSEKQLFMKLLYDLCQTIEEPEQAFGRPKLPITDMIFASALKVYSTFSLRRFISDMKTAKEKNYVSITPCFASVGHFMQKEEMMSILLKMIEITSLSLKGVETEFAIDSSGFSTSQFGRWFDFRYGKDQTKRMWIKAHLMCGVKTNIITSLKLTHGYDGDAKHMPELVQSTSRNFDISEVSADKGYLSRKNMEVVQDAGGTAYIPFRSNSSGRANKSRLWKKMYHMFMYNQEEFRKHYHKRSNVETTFFMIKAKFGTHIRSKSEVAMHNEVLLKALCHNICVVIHEMFELGIKPEFN